MSRRNQCLMQWREPKVKGTVTAKTTHVRHHYIPIKTHMKSLLHSHYIVTALFVLLALVGCSRRSDNPQSGLNRQRDIVLHAESDALYAKIVLTNLRDGHLTNALELLEMQIDTSIIMIDHSLSNISGAERETDLGTLRSLKTYREAHPRQQEAVFQDADKEDEAAMIQASQKASRILSDLK
jgi:hypothetical protein